MNVELKPDLESRLREVARHRSLSLPELVEQVLRNYVESQTENPITWVRATEQQLQGVWPREDFSDWDPPHAR